MIDFIKSKVLNIEFDKKSQKYIYTFSKKINSTILHNSPYSLPVNRSIYLIKIGNWYFSQLLIKLIFLISFLPLPIIATIKTLSHFNLNLSFSLILIFSTFLFTYYMFNNYMTLITRVIFWNNKESKSGEIISQITTFKDSEIGNLYLYEIKTHLLDQKVKTQVSSTQDLSINSKVTVVFPKGQPHLAEIKNLKDFIGLELIQVAVFISLPILLLCLYS